MFTRGFDSTNTRCSATDPNDGIATPQEPQIRQAETQMQNAKETFSDASATAAQANAVGAVGVATGQPYATTMAGGATVYQIGRMNAAANSMQEARAIHDQKLAEEQQYLRDRK